MPRVDIVVESKVSNSSRVRQLESMFDVPQVEVSRLEWHYDVPLPAEWNVGLIVGPSGSGKTLAARTIFGEHFCAPLKWGKASVIDDFDPGQSMQDISAVCQAVGFNTIPAWMRPFGVLSNGEQFRVELARRILETPPPIVVDEFTSVVDRQVAQIGAHAVQKFVRRAGTQFVAVSCHYDIIDWLQPDWILEPAAGKFSPRGSLRRRPELPIEIARVDYSAWKFFAPFHYLTADLNHAAACFCLFVDDRPASFGAMLHRPISRDKHAQHIWGLSRLVTLPDWQGLGLAMVLSDALGSAYKARGERMHTYPAHPALIRSYDHSPKWGMVKKPGTFSARGGETGIGWKGSRPCAVFQYAGPADEAAMKSLLN